MTTPESRIAELGMTLPPVPAPVASYVPVVQTGNLVFTSGQLPLVDGALSITGKVGAEVSRTDRTSSWGEPQLPDCSIVNKPMFIRKI